jgi:hypothetical protein
MSNKAAVARNQSRTSQSLQILVCAFVTGLSIPPAWFGILRLSVMWPINTPSWRFITTWTLISLGSYLSAGLLFIAIRVMRTHAFNWLLLSVCGALVLAIVYTFHVLPISQLSFTELLLVHFRDALGTTLWLSLFTLPISALVYYSTSYLFTRGASNNALQLTAR